MRFKISANESVSMNSGYSEIPPVAGVGIEPVLIKKRELARRLSVSTRTIDDWSRKRMIPYIPVSPRMFLYNFDEVLASLRKNYQIDPIVR